MGNCLEWVKTKKIFKQANFAQNHKILSKISSKIDHINPFLFQLSTQFELGNLMDIGLYLDLCGYKKFSMQNLVVF